MPETLTLPNGDTVTPDDVFLYNGYPYRYVPVDDATADVEFYLSPLYWGGGDMDIPFRSHEMLAEQWGPESEGLLTDEEWAAWLREARTEDRFDDEELDAVEREILGGGLLGRLRRALFG